MNEAKVRKLARFQAIMFWLGAAVGGIMLWLVIAADPGSAPSPIFHGLFFFQLFLGLAFVVASGFLAIAVKKSPIVWSLVPLLLGPIGFILAYAMLSTTANKWLVGSGRP